ncbi:hypothetical protein COOONC_05456, partial [Cooperia oncophora]
MNLRKKFERGTLRGGLNRPQHLTPDTSCLPPTLAPLPSEIQQEEIKRKLPEMPSQEESEVTSQKESPPPPKSADRRQDHPSFSGGPGGRGPPGHPPGFPPGHPPPPGFPMPPHPPPGFPPGPPPPGFPPFPPPPGFRPHFMGPFPPPSRRPGNASRDNWPIQRGREAIVEKIPLDDPQADCDESKESEESQVEECVSITTEDSASIITENDSHDNEGG